jgi:hypothetical protein
MYRFMRFEVLTAASMKMVVFLVVAYSSVEVYRHFRAACCLHHQGDRRRQQSPCMGLIDVFVTVRLPNALIQHLCMYFDFLFIHFYET